jgi:hypothetical protein
MRSITFAILIFAATGICGVKAAPWSTADEQAVSFLIHSAPPVMKKTFGVLYPHLKFRDVRAFALTITGPTIGTHTDLCGDVYVMERWIPFGLDLNTDQKIIIEVGWVPDAAQTISYTCRNMQSSEEVRRINSGQDYTDLLARAVAR